MNEEFIGRVGQEKTSGETGNGQLKIAAPGQRLW